MNILPLKLAFFNRKIVYYNGKNVIMHRKTRFCNKKDIHKRQ